MSSILRTYGTGHCVICGYSLPLDQKRYCLSCWKTRPEMIRRLEADDDLLRIMVLCTRKGAKVPPGMWTKAIGAVLHIRIQPLLDWFEGQVQKGRLTPVRFGVLWVDIATDVHSFYQGIPKKTDAWKTERYNNTMRPRLAVLFHDSLLVMSVAQFRAERDRGFDFLFPKGQDVG